MPQIEKEYVETGKIKYAFFDFPLDMHKNAFKASEAANCADDQGKFWEMHVKLFENQKELGQKELPNYAAALGLDLQKFNECMGKGKYAEKVRKEIEEGKKAGITGTPAFFIGLTSPDNPKIKLIKKIVGAQPLASFKEAIEGVISTQK